MNNLSPIILNNFNIANIELNENANYIFVTDTNSKDINLSINDNVNAYVVLFSKINSNVNLKVVIN